ncbi:Importin 1 [Novymonas esmeraldas]|uniref:Importin 1 n=1 Tax=Novymonas esmeraldas TaxID=1808958 RepID=A0AAW0EUH5_9TRYP
MASVAPQIFAALAAASSPVAETRHQGESQLQQLKENPTLYFSSCAEILVSQQADLRGRQLVGFQLKNNLANPACAQNEQLKAAVCEHAIVDPQRVIRNVAGSILSVAVREGLWDAKLIVCHLGTILTQRSSELCAVHGAIRTMSYVVDDSIQLLDETNLTRSVLLAAVPFLSSTAFGTTSVEAVEIRLKAFEIVALVLEQAGLDFKCNTYTSLQGTAVGVVQACFENLRNPLSHAIATHCVRCIVLSLTFYEEIDNALFSQIGQLMLSATTSGGGGAAASAEEESLRMEATEFWRAILHFPRFAELAQSTVVQLVPVMIQAMHYSSMEMSMLQASANDWQVPDRADSIRPHRFREHGRATEGGDDGGGDGDGDGDDDDDEEVEEWNLRRVSALTLDDISQYYGDVVLQPVLNCVASMIHAGPGEWRRQEAAVLAIGAVSEGCYASLEQFLPGISETLLQLLEAPDTHFLVVDITLWTCTRIGSFFLADPALLRRLMVCILRKMENPSKKVQGGAVEALQEMLQSADAGAMDVMAPAIVESIATCFGAYQLRNRVLLLEAVQTVCQTIGGAVRASDHLVSVLLTPLGKLWEETPNDSPLLWSLFDCMSSVCTALGPAMQPMAVDIFNRGFGLLQDHMQQRYKATQDGDVLPDEEFAVTSAILLSGLFDAIGAGLEPLVAQRQPLFTQVLLSTLSDPSPSVRQNGFCLASDIARGCPMHLQQVLPAFCEAAVQNASNVDESSYSVVSNVAWAVCNLLEHEVVGAGAPTLQSSPAMVQLFGLLARLLSRGGISSEMRNMAENVALCLGIMLYLDHDVESKAGCSAQVFAGEFCRYVRNIREHSSGLEAAVGGFVAAAQRDITIALNNFVMFCELGCSAGVENDETRKQMREVLTAASRANPNMCRQALASCTETTRRRLYERYGFP